MFYTEGPNVFSVTDPAKVWCKNNFYTYYVVQSTTSMQSLGVWAHAPQKINTYSEIDFGGNLWKKQLSFYSTETI